MTSRLAWKTEIPVYFSVIIALLFSMLMIVSYFQTVHNDLIASLKQQFILTVAGDVGVFLGIQIHHHNDGK